MFTRLEGRLARELQKHTGLSMADYTVLSNLVEVEQRKWRITSMAEHMQWSQSRLSHQVRRMEERGLVRREEDRGDARGTLIALTKDGLHAIAAAAPEHFGSVRRHMLDLLTERQLASLGQITDIVLTHLDGLDDSEGIDD